MELLQSDWLRLPLVSEWREGGRGRSRRDDTASRHVLLCHMTQLWCSSGFSTPALLHFPSSIHAPLSFLTLVLFSHWSEKSAFTECNKTRKMIKESVPMSLQVIHYIITNIKVHPTGTTTFQSSVDHGLCSSSVFTLIESSCLPSPVWYNHSSRFKLLILPGTSVCWAPSDSSMLAVRLLKNKHIIYIPAGRHETIAL